jgi:hypothetical protein
MRFFLSQLALISFIALGIGGIVAGIELSAWEAANGYPFGRLCEPFLQCR